MQITLDILRGFLAIVLVIAAIVAIGYFVIPGISTFPLTPAAKLRTITAMIGGGAVLIFVLATGFVVAANWR